MRSTMLGIKPHVGNFNNHAVEMRREIKKWMGFPTYDANDPEGNGRDGNGRVVKINGKHYRYQKLAAGLIGGNKWELCFTPNNTTGKQPGLRDYFNDSQNLRNYIHNLAIASNTNETTLVKCLLDSIDKGKQLTTTPPQIMFDVPVFFNKDGTVVNNGGGPPASTVSLFHHRHVKYKDGSRGYGGGDGIKIDLNTALQATRIQIEASARKLAEAKAAGGYDEVIGLLPLPNAFLQNVDYEQQTAICHRIIELCEEMTKYKVRLIPMGGPSPETYMDQKGLTKHIIDERHKKMLLNGGEGKYEMRDIIYYFHQQNENNKALGKKTLYCISDNAEHDFEFITNAAMSPRALKATEEYFGRLTGLTMFLLAQQYMFRGGPIGYPYEQALRNYYKELVTMKVPPMADGNSWIYNITTDKKNPTHHYITVNSAPETQRLVINKQPLSHAILQSKLTKALLNAEQYITKTVRIMLKNKSDNLSTAISCLLDDPKQVLWLERAVVELSIPEGFGNVLFKKNKITGDLELNNTTNGLTLQNRIVNTMGNKFKFDTLDSSQKEDFFKFLAKVSACLQSEFGNVEFHGIKKNGSIFGMRGKRVNIHELQDAYLSALKSIDSLKHSKTSL